MFQAQGTTTFIEFGSNIYFLNLEPKWLRCEMFDKYTKHQKEALEATFRLLLQNSREVLETVFESSIYEHATKLCDFLWSVHRLRTV